jgi:hypothetical protein
MRNCSMMTDCTGLQRAGREDNLCGMTSIWMTSDYLEFRCRLATDLSTYVNMFCGGAWANSGLSGCTYLVRYTTLAS